MNINIIFVDIFRVIYLKNIIIILRGSQDKKKSQFKMRRLRTKRRVLSVKEICNMNTIVEFTKIKAVIYYINRDRRFD